MRYIDADKLIEHIHNMPWKMDSAAEITKFIFLSTVEEAPTADVVPKSEYDEVLSNWQKIHDSYTADCIDHYNKGRQEVAREIFEEIEFDIHQLMFEREEHRAIAIEGVIAELKKKYTGERKMRENENHNRNTRYNRLCVL